MRTDFSQLIDGRQIWLGSQQAINEDYQTTGYPLLDEKLSGGWPKQGIIELQTNNGIGELRLMAPYLTSNANEEQLLLFINPPSVINSQMLSLNGLEPASALVINHSDSDKQLWCAEQSLLSGCVSSVVLWQTQLSSCQVKRLKLAAKATGSRLIVIRPPNQLATLPVNLSLALMPCDEGLTITIKKQQGHWPQPLFVLDMSERWPDLVTHITRDNVIALGKRRVS